MGDHLPPTGWKFHQLDDSVDDELLSSLKRSFDEDGFICLASLFDEETVQRLREAAAVNFEECFQRLYDVGHTSFPRYCDEGDKKEYAISQGVKGGFKEIVMRSPGRFEMPFGCDRPPFNDEAIVRNEPLLQVVKALFSGEEHYMCNLSIVYATPGSSDQGWHADGGHINLQAHEGCHCFNVFVPLVDVNRSLGPTELRPGSQYLTRNLAPMMLAAKARGKLRKPAMPLLRAGDCLLFDYRVLHRGRANVSEVDRPILVMTFAKRTFKDRLNFPSKSIDDCPPRDVEVEEK
uniref:Fe2OG dioxygenase domain-containing protein n=1 Tax=Minutocellus polymorphus TaxID=265543 RepID=A0A7S0B054_9STRA|mmetsp:Transcript_8145/g.13503  ORF Transcript_8145/g.13503 Transcript_8145/m.13503 type:complete len:291 (+) Transcript_8145:145-1017(+)